MKKAFTNYKWAQDVKYIHSLRPHKIGYQKTPFIDQEPLESSVDYS